MKKFLIHLLHLIISPGRGWEDISHEGQDPKSIVSDGLYPLLGIVSLSAFLTYFHDTDYGLVTLLQQAIIVFVQYFISYFIATFMYSMYLAKYVDGEPNENKSCTLIAYSLALMSIITLISNCVPIELALIEFLPIYVAVVIWKGCQYMAINKEKEGRYMILAIVSIIFPPILLNYLFNLFIS